MRWFWLFKRKDLYGWSVLSLSYFDKVYRYLVYHYIIMNTYQRGCHCCARMVVGFYNYLCNQCLSPPKLWVWNPFMACSTWYNVMWYSLSTCNRSVVFSAYSGFLHQWNWSPRYSWNIVESGCKHHNHNPENLFILNINSYWFNS